MKITADSIRNKISLFSIDMNSLMQYRAIVQAAELAYPRLFTRGVASVFQYLTNGVIAAFAERMAA
jgi:hypothetical protein